MRPRAASRGSTGVVRSGDKRAAFNASRIACTHGCKGAGEAPRREQTSTRRWKAMVVRLQKVVPRCRMAQVQFHTVNETADRKT